ncbi:hypothetical protein [Mastigocoleus sp. MO_188.B34]|uniref:hypothetical protein n=1 Tax=Mastigocoleus sp. MO_188.B34 TaxID=3036635 RepID=UPI00262603CA|nr:hypothetical protein [Mastigocoleus sp. MO_188.B34]
MLNIIKPELDFRCDRGFYVSYFHFQGGVYPLNPPWETQFCLQNGLDPPKSPLERGTLRFS